jgi:hypothetical protein
MIPTSDDIFDPAAPGGLAVCYGGVIVGCVVAHEGSYFAFDTNAVADRRVSDAARGSASKSNTAARRLRAILKGLNRHEHEVREGAGRD